MPAQHEDTNKYVVTQSNNLIEANYSDAKLPAKAMKIARLLVSKISPDDNNLRLIKIKNAAIREYLGYKKNVPYNRFNKDLLDVCQRLNKQPVTILTEEKKILNAYFISSWESNTISDTTEFEISGKLRKYLVQLKENFTSYQLQNIPKLNSAYSIRIYELLISYRKIGKRKFTVEDLKSKIGCNYELYGHFKKKALLKAQQDLRDHTNIRFEFEEIKNGRKVVELQFYIYPNKPEKQSSQTVLAFLDDSIEINTQIGFTEEVVKRIYDTGISYNNITKYTQIGFEIIKDKETRNNAMNRCKTLEDYYCEKLTLLEQSKVERNPAGFLIKALKEDWQIQEISKRHNEAKEGREKVKRYKHIQKLKREYLALVKKHNKDIDALFSSWITENTDIFAQIYDSIEDNGSVVRLKKPHLNPMENYAQSPFLKAEVQIRIRQQYPTVIRSLEEQEIYLGNIRQELKEAGENI